MRKFYFVKKDVSKYPKVTITPTRITVKHDSYETCKDIIDWIINVVSPQIPMDELSMRGDFYKNRLMLSHQIKSGKILKTLVFEL